MSALLIAVIFVLIAFLVVSQYEFFQDTVNDRVNDYINPRYQAQPVCFGNLPANPSPKADCDPADPVGKIHNFPEVNYRDPAISTLARSNKMIMESDPGVRFLPG